MSTKEKALKKKRGSKLVIKTVIDLEDPNKTYEFKNEELVNLYFEEPYDANPPGSAQKNIVAKCHCGVIVSCGRGFQNRFQHIDAVGGHQSEWKKVMAHHTRLEAQKGKLPRQSLLPFAKRKSDEVVHNDRTKKVYNWLNFMIGTNLPFKFVESPYARIGMAFPPISRNFFLKGMDTLAKQHYEEIREILLPKKFGICFDGWTESHTHYVALIAVFPAVDEILHHRLQ